MITVKVSECCRRAIYEGKQYKVVGTRNGTILLQPLFPIDMPMDCPIEYEFKIIQIRITLK